MYVEIVKTQRNRLGMVTVNREEAVALIRSLSTQLDQNFCNSGRLESRCRGDADEFTIFIDPNEGL